MSSATVILLTGVMCAAACSGGTFFARRPITIAREEGLAVHWSSTADEGCPDPRLPALGRRWLAPAAAGAWELDSTAGKWLTALGGVVAAAGIVLVLDLVSGGADLDPLGVAWAVLAMVGCATFFVLSGFLITGILVILAVATDQVSRRRAA